MTPGLTVLFAVACGATVANNYYAQPLLEVIAAEFAVGTVAAGLVVTAAQVGYTAGLLLLVPLGDVLERRRLIVALLCVCAAALAAAALAPSLAWLAACAVLASATSVVAQVLVPFAATLSDDAERGEVIGRVMTGLLLGILAARTVSGLIAGLGGWRAVYAAAAGGMVVLAVVLHRRLPASAPATRLAYPALLRSVWRLVAEEPALRRRGAYGALTFGAFGALWTTIAFLLAGEPYGYSEAVIGLFGLAGVAGALAASRAGRLHDRGRGHAGTGAALALGVVAFGLIALGRRELAALLAGVVLMDLAVQGTQILNQATVYALRADARSRLTTAYMTTYFAGGALGSGLGAVAYATWGWAGTAAVGGGLFGAALALWRPSRAIDSFAAMDWSKGSTSGRRRSSSRSPTWWSTPPPSRRASRCSTWPAAPATRRWSRRRAGPR
jgi:predicted MFS family arabinose efflux permease